MNKEKILEKITPFAGIRDIKDITALLNSSEMIDKFRVIPLLNNFFNVKIKFKDGREKKYDYYSIISISVNYTQEKVSSSEVEHILIWRKSNLSESTIFIKDIEDYEVDLSSFNLFSSKEELAAFCDRRFISDKGIDYVWELYTKNVLPKMKEGEYGYYFFIESFTKRIKEALSKICIKDFPKDRVVTVEDKKGEISRHYFLPQDNYIVIRTDIKNRYGIILNKDCYFLTSYFINKEELSELDYKMELYRLKRRFKKLEYGPMKVTGR